MRLAAERILNMRHLISALALCAVLALPAAAEAGSPQIDPGAGLKFNALVAQKSSLSASGEPTINCNFATETAEFLSSTTGTIALGLFECHIIVLGITSKCTSVGSTTEGNIFWNESVFHTTYLTDSKTKPGILVTPPFATITCGTAASIRIEGIGLLGTLTGFECGKSSKTATLSFVAAGATQEHQTITGTGSSVWSLEERTYTKKEVAVKAGLNLQIPFTFYEEKTATMTCV